MFITIDPKTGRQEFPNITFFFLHSGLCAGALNFLFFFLFYFYFFILYFFF